MIDKIINGFMSRLKVEGIAEIKFGRGVTSKTSSSLIFLVLAIAVIALWGPSSSDKPLIIGMMIGLYIFYAIGTWVHTSINPHEALDGVQLRTYLTDRDRLNAMDEKIIDVDAQPVDAPKIQEITQDQDGEKNA
ncbi:MAG: hypothetical protein ACX94B_03730 [Henriciella sp.]